MNHITTQLALRLATVIALSSWCLFAKATNYHVSPSGNDANTGTSESQAWRTIDRVNQISFGLQPGDKVLFQKGGTYRGTLVIASSGTSNSPVTVGSYGTGAQPIISGSKVLSGWTVHQGNIWKVPVSEPIGFLFSNNQLMTIARYPNTGWLRNDVGTSTRINDDALTQPSGYWNGADVVIRGSNWSYDISKVTASIPGRIDFTDMYMSLDTNHWGYFLRNKLSELDQPGEYYQDVNAGMLYFQAPANADPNTLSIEACVRQRGAWIYLGWQHIVIENLKFKHQTERSVFIDDAHHITVRNCTFEDLAEGVFSYSVIGQNKYQNNLFNRTYHTALYINDQNSQITANTFTNIAMQPGLGETNWGYMGIRVLGSNNAVRENRMNTIGYIGISVHGNTMVERNFVQNAMALLNDGCGIGMENADGVVVRDNIILDISGNLESSAPNAAIYWHQGMGIYFGNISVRNTLVQNNTIGNCKGYGIHVDHTMVSTGNQIKDNVLYNNAVQLSLSDFSNYNGPGATAPYHVPSFNTVYSGNVMYSLQPGQLCMKMLNCYSTNWVDFGDFSNNFYFNPYNEMSIQRYNTQGSGIKNYYLEKWQQVSGEDAGSTRSPLRLETMAVTNVISNNLVANGSFDANVGGWQGWPTQGLMTHDYTQLDNGAMKVNFSNNTNGNNFTATNTALSQLQAGQWYRLKFSIISNMLGTLEAGVKTQTQMTGPQMVVRESVPFTSERRDVTMLFQSGLTDQGFCSFTNNYQESTYWIDNIQLQSVAVQPLDPLEKHVLLYNDSAVAVSVPLVGCWSDVHGQFHSGSINIPAYSSIVLVKEDDILCGLSTGIEAPTAAAEKGRVHPNPVQAGGELFLTEAPTTASRLDILDTRGSVVRTVRLGAGQRSLVLDTELPPGAYVLRSQGGTPWVSRIMVL